MVDVKRPDRAAWTILAAGLLLMVLVQLPVRHLAIALYDGVEIIRGLRKERYRFDQS